MCGDQLAVLTQRFSTGPEHLVLSCKCEQLACGIGKLVHLLLRSILSALERQCGGDARPMALAQFSDDLLVALHLLQGATDIFVDKVHRVIPPTSLLVFRAATSSEV